MEASLVNSALPYSSNRSRVETGVKHTHAKTQRRPLPSPMKFQLECREVEGQGNRSIKWQMIPPSVHLSSRSDHEQILAFDGPHGSINLYQDPLVWLNSNPFINQLTHSDLRFDNLLRFLYNQRGYFLCRWRTEAERDYLNFSLNSGVPFVKKREPIQEGIFAIHDGFHVVFKDPLISGCENEMESAVYLLFRMMSEACTLILADVFAVHQSAVRQSGYDVSPRKIYPLFQSLGKPLTWELVKELMWANVQFCIKGDVILFESLGAGSCELAEYTSKYAPFFAEDLRCNVHNITESKAKALAGGSAHDYLSGIDPRLNWFNNHTLYQLVRNKSGQIDVRKLFGLFVAQVERALGYSDRISPERQRIVASKYLSGQVKIAYDYPNYPAAQRLRQAYQVITQRLSGLGVREVRNLTTQFSLVVAELVDDLYIDGVILPHQRSEFKLHYPHYSSISTNYDLGISAYPSLQSLYAKHFGNRLSW